MIPIVLAGPTASGKSALAFLLAEALGGEIINADSCQLYRDFPILSGLPRGKLCGVPHHLYGVLTYEQQSSAGWWRTQALRVIEEVQKRQRVPLIVGGTGLYLKVLLEGVRIIPPISEEIRCAVRARFSSLGRERFWQELQALDPLATQYLRSTDSQRLQRAYEVKIATQRSLFAWPVSETEKGLSALVIKMTPCRHDLYAACDARFDMFLEHGALDEVSHFLNHISPQDTLKTVKTIGVVELGAYLTGSCSLENAIAAAKMRTRRYAKRQGTWFRHQLRAQYTVDKIVSFERKRKTGDSPLFQVVASVGANISSQKLRLTLQRVLEVPGVNRPSVECH
ncbi:MAG: tRNA (adenosine(37)-N6)-dimethylallyltransferase MiaA [Holosporales bacterium]|nr:tRNA (adenosine(37)-N6)-dimethylallyltransferase MiaA [Holosporales bacterium]